jgi:cytochrome c oxidase subunit II
VTEGSVTARRFEFEPSRIVVRQGDRVRLTVSTADGTHGLAIKKLGVHQVIKKGSAPATIEFVADKVGTFEITCSEYCGSGHERMKGQLVVEPGGQGGIE